MALKLYVKKEEKGRKERRIYMVGKNGRGQGGKEEEGGVRWDVPVRARVGPDKSICMILRDLNAIKKMW